MNYNFSAGFSDNEILCIIHELFFIHLPHVIYSGHFPGYFLGKSSQFLLIIMDIRFNGLSHDTSNIRLSNLTSNFENLPFPFWSQVNMNLLCLSLSYLLNLLNIIHQSLDDFLTLMHFLIN